MRNVTMRTPEEQSAYDTGWHLREIGHLEMLDSYKHDPKLRKAFEQGWNDAAAWCAKKEQA